MGASGRSTCSGESNGRVRWLRKPRSGSGGYNPAHCHGNRCDSGGNIFVVDPSDPLDSRFAEAINVPADNYIRMNWGEFMKALSERLVTEHRVEMVRDCANLVAENGLDHEDVTDICDQSGRTRNPCTGQDSSYMDA